MEVQMQEDHHHHDHQVHMNSNMVMIKRRRTKRPRPSSPLALTIATSSCSTVEGTHGSGELEGHVANSSSSPSNSGVDHLFVRNINEEEEDMAKCLILLAQGRNNYNNQKLSFSPSPSHVLDVYQCKTCNRSFPSFQALGGHRASHKKPKLPTTSLDEKNLKSIEQVENYSKMNDDHVTTLSLQISSSSNNNNNNSNSNSNNNNNAKNKNRVHECSICGAEFTSGQALGGHMRRHRPLPNSIAIANTTSSDQLGSSHETKNSTRAFLSLDLNLPAPEDDHHRPESKFSFASKEQVIVFSASPLVDCHY